jgi:hypothetical protein
VQVIQLLPTTAKPSTVSTRRLEQATPYPWCAVPLCFLLTDPVESSINSRQGGSPTWNIWRASSRVNSLLSQTRPSYSLLGSASHTSGTLSLNRTRTLVLVAAGRHNWLGVAARN